MWCSLVLVLGGLGKIRIDPPSSSAKVRPLQQLRLLHSPVQRPRTFTSLVPAPATCHRRPHNGAIIMTDLCLKQQPDMPPIMHTYWDIAVGGW